MKILALALVALVTIILWLFLRSRPRVMTEAQFVATLEAWANDSLTAGDWDYFECCELSAPRLEAARKRCVLISLDPAYTTDPKDSWRLNDAGKAEVLKLLLQFHRQDSAAT
jgi:hypothetical protein